MKTLFRLSEDSRLGSVTICFLAAALFSAPPITRAVAGQTKSADSWMAKLPQVYHTDGMRNGIQSALDWIERIGKGKGGIVVGQIVLDGPGDVTEVMVQMPVLKDGFFAGAVADLEGPIGFRHHGYAPLDVELRGRTGEIVDLGILRMKPLPPEQLCKVTGSIALEGGTDPQSTKVLFTVQHDKINTPGNLTSPRAKWAAPISVPVDGDGKITGDGFSPIKHYLEIQRMGYAPKEYPVEFKPGETLDLGVIVLEKAKQVDMEYVTAKTLPFDCSAPKKLRLNAGERDIPSSLEFHQANGAVTCWSYYGGQIADLGEGTLQERGKNLGVAEPRLSNFKDIHPQNGHVYMVKSWYQNVLFHFDVK